VVPGQKPGLEPEPARREPGNEPATTAPGGQEEKGKRHRIVMKTVRSTRPGSEDSQAHGLIRVEGNMVTLVYDYSAMGQFPEGFETDSESQNAFVLRKDAEKRGAIHPPDRDQPQVEPRNPR
jgi:hypothetical protein